LVPPASGAFMLTLLLSVWLLLSLLDCVLLSPANKLICSASSCSAPATATFEPFTFISLSVEKLAVTIELTKSRTTKSQCFEQTLAFRFNAFYSFLKKILISFRGSLILTWYE
jgi:hypothetical protein